MTNTGKNAYFVLDTSGVASTESHVLFPWSKAASGLPASGHRIRALDTGPTGLCPQLIMIIFTKLLFVSFKYNPFEFIVTAESLQGGCL